VKLCCQYDMVLCCSTCPVMPNQTRDAIVKQKLLIFCYSLAAIDLTAANLITLQQQLAVLLGPVSLRMEILTKRDAP